MRRRLWVLVLLVLPVEGAINLYLKDGTYQRVREYQVLEDRVRYYSTERSDWEEIPLELIDLRRTREEQAELEAERKAERIIDQAEEQAERARAREIARVPQAPGVYLVNSGELVALKQAEASVVRDRKRSILKILSPLPIVAGKSTLELEGVRSSFAVSTPEPEFYFRLYAAERFAMVRLTGTKDSRVVETWSTMPVTNELIQEHTAVEIFQQQAGPDLYKIWPRQRLEQGEYAIIEFTQGAGNTQIWDFSVRAAGKP